MYFFKEGKMPLNLNLQQNLQTLGVWRVVFFFLVAFIGL